MVYDHTFSSNLNRKKLFIYLAICILLLNYKIMTIIIFIQPLNAISGLSKTIDELRSSFDCLRS
jgi:hypothetical protein